MSDSSANPRALLMDTLPPLLPPGHAVNCSLQIQVVCNDRINLYFAHEGEPPVEERKRNHEMGTPLPPEDCDVIVVLCTSAQHVMAPAIVGPGGQRTQPNASTVAHTVLARVPLADWQASHLGNLRGGNPS
jgi:hypothetical protein